jgi:uncharacterized UPF0160 family protein
MPLLAVTHSGPFHADDVLAYALIRAWVDPEPGLVRSRDPVDHARGDWVFDVGGVFDASKHRFDHHQAEYQGDRSSAGLVLDAIETEGRVDAELAALLRRELVDYVDAVDNGRVVPTPDRPCFARHVQVLNQGCSSFAEFDRQFRVAADMAYHLVKGIEAGLLEDREAQAVVLAAMRAAERSGSRVLDLGQYVRWKPAYFANGGVTHPTDFVLFPALDGTWQLVAIPPDVDSFAQKVPFPASWAGLVDARLQAACGIPGARFCHKNRFIAVFDTKDGALAAVAAMGLR